MLPPRSLSFTEIQWLSLSTGYLSTENKLICVPELPLSHNELSCPEPSQIWLDGTKSPSVSHKWNIFPTFPYVRYFWCCLRHACRKCIKNPVFAGSSTSAWAFQQRVWNMHSSFIPASAAQQPAEEEDGGGHQQFVVTARETLVHRTAWAWICLSTSEVQCYQGAGGRDVSLFGEGERENCFQGWSCSWLERALLRHRRFRQTRFLLNTALIQALWHRAVLFKAAPGLPLESSLLFSLPNHSNSSHEAMVFIFFLFFDFF